MCYDCANGCLTSTWCSRKHSQKALCQTDEQVNNLIASIASMLKNTVTQSIQNTFRNDGCVTLLR